MNNAIEDALTLILDFIDRSGTLLSPELREAGETVQTYLNTFSNLN